MRATSVLMLVYMEVASAVNKRAEGWTVSLERMDFNSKESLKKEACLRARGWSSWSTHLPRLWG